MEWSYYLYLYPAYAFGLLAWHFTQHRQVLTSVPDSSEYTRPALEFSFVVAAIVGVILMGQLYQQGYLLTANDYWRPLKESINQLIIFAPILLLVPLRRQPWTSAWIPTHGRAISILKGLAIALVAILIHLALRGSLSEVGSVLLDVYHPKQLHLMVQVLLEDIAIAICFVRFQQWVGGKRAIIIVGVLFAAAHIPAMLSENFEASQLIGLALDAGLAISALWILSRYENILWFWMLHYAMDMMQFVG